jgi:hypothetical protein
LLGDAGCPGGDSPEIEFQPALVSVFKKCHADEELTPREAAKEHLWDLHFSEYGR